MKKDKCRMAWSLMYVFGLMLRSRIMFMTAEPFALEWGIGMLHPLQGETLEALLYLIAPYSTAVCSQRSSGCEEDLLGVRSIQERLAGCCGLVRLKELVATALLSTRPRKEGRLQNCAIREIQGKLNGMEIRQRCINKDCLFKPFKWGLHPKRAKLIPRDCIRAVSDHSIPI